MGYLRQPSTYNMRWNPQEADKSSAGKHKTQLLLIITIQRQIRLFSKHRKKFPYADKNILGYF